MYNKYEFILVLELVSLKNSYLNHLFFHSAMQSLENYTQTLVFKIQMIFDI